jgi:hypothetical protein
MENMKKSISVVLGLVAGTFMTFSQGSIHFDNYGANNGDGVPTTYGAGVAGHPAGAGLTSGWTAGLLYSTFPIVEGATVNSADAAASLNGAWLIALNTGVYGFGLPGFYWGPDFVLSGGVEGQVVYFQIIAFETGAVGANSAEKYMNSTVRGHSASFTGILHVYPQYAPVYMDNMQPFSVFTIPEPSILVLAGLGLAAVAAYRRKQD